MSRDSRRTGSLAIFKPLSLWSSDLVTTIDVLRSGWLHRGAGWHASLGGAALAPHRPGRRMLAQLNPERATAEATPRTASTARRLYALAWPERWQLVGALVFLLIGSAGALGKWSGGTEIFVN